QRLNVHLNRVTYHTRPRRDRRGRFSVKLQHPVRARIDLRATGPASNACAPDHQRSVSISVGDLDPDLSSTGADVHDEAQALVSIGLERLWQKRLRGCGPCSDPLFGVLI